MCKVSKVSSVIKYEGVQRERMRGCEIYVNIFWRPKINLFCYGSLCYECRIVYVHDTKNNKFSRKKYWNQNTTVLVTMDFHENRWGGQNALSLIFVKRNLGKRFRNSRLKRRKRNESIKQTLSKLKKSFRKMQLKGKLNWLIFSLPRENKKLLNYSKNVLSWKRNV